MPVIVKSTVLSVSQKFNIALFHLTIFRTIGSKLWFVGYNRLTYNDIRPTILTLTN